MNMKAFEKQNLMIKGVKLDMIDLLLNYPYKPECLLV
jgi:hypothetical protein